MKVKTQSELQHLIQMFLKATEEPDIEHIYLFEDTYYLLRSTNSHKNKSPKVRLVETDIQGDYLHEGDVSLLLEAEEFKCFAKIIGVRKSKYKL